MIRFKHRANDVKDPLRYLAVEIDVQIVLGELTIAHDAHYPECTLKEYLANCSEHNILAINVKQSGLCDMLERAMKSSQVKNYFYFDMAVPDLVEYVKKCPEHTAFRLSEYETNFHFSCDWVWVDFFGAYKYGQEKAIKAICETLKEKKCVVVSPELHGFDFEYEDIAPYGICSDN